MIKNINELADRLKGIKVNGEELNAEKLSTLISDESEHELELSSVNVLTEEELSTFKENIGKDAASKGAKTMVEMQVKDLRNEYGLEFEGKTIKNLLESYASKKLKEAKVPEQAKVQELQQSLETLQNKYQTDLGTKDQEIQSLQSKFKQFEYDNKLASVAPQNMVGIKPKQAVALFKMEYGLEEDESGNLLVKQGGKVLKDNLENPLKYDEVFNDYVKQNGWLKVEGRGNGNESGGPGAEFKTINDVYAHFEKNGIDPTSSQAASMIDKFNQSQE